MESYIRRDFLQSRELESERSKLKEEGDECLKKVASVLLKYARRAGDTVARYGREKYVILLPGISVN